MVLEQEQKIQRSCEKRAKGQLLRRDERRLNGPGKKTANAEKI